MTSLIRITTSLKFLPICILPCLTLHILMACNFCACWFEIQDYFSKYFQAFDKTVPNSLTIFTCSKRCKVVLCLGFVASKCRWQTQHLNPRLLQLYFLNSHSQKLFFFLSIFTFSLWHMSLHHHLGLFKSLRHLALNTIVRWDISFSERTVQPHKIHSQQRQLSAHNHTKLCKVTFWEEKFIKTFQRKLTTTKISVVVISLVEPDVLEKI